MHRENLSAPCSEGKWPSSAQMLTLSCLEWLRAVSELVCLHAYVCLCPGIRQKVKRQGVPARARSWRLTEADGDARTTTIGHNPLAKNDEVSMPFIEHMI